MLHAVQLDEDLRLRPKKVSAKGRGILEEDPGYDCSHMSTWRWLSNNTIFVPGMGKLATTGFAERGAGNKLGFRADVFLGPIRHDPKLVQQALQPSVSARKGDKELLVKVIAKKFPEGKAPLGFDGIMRGVVSPTYGEIRDAQVLNALEKRGGPKLKEMKIRSRRTEAASYFTFAYPNTRRIKALSEIGDDIIVGFKGWNSEVGYKALQFDTFLERLVCTNGLVIRLGGESLFSRRHVSIEDSELEYLIDEMMKKIPDLNNKILKGAESLHNIPVEDPEKELNSFLAQRGESKYIREAAAKAYTEEPIPTAYGVMQAITRISVAASIDADRQLRLEQHGGMYMAKKLIEA